MPLAARSSSVIKWKHQISGRAETAYWYACRIGGNIHRFKLVSQKCYIHFRINFHSSYSYFHFSSMYPAIIDHAYSLTYHTFLPFITCQKNCETLTQFDNFPLAWHFFAKNSGPAILVGLVAFHHWLNRKRRSQSPLFALCSYAMHINCAFCSGPSRRQRSTEVSVPVF